MKYVFQRSAERLTALSFYTGWLLCSAFFLIDEAIGFKRELAVIWFVLFVLTAAVACNAMASRSRRATGNAYEAGRSQGAIDTWATVKRLAGEES